MDTLKALTFFLSAVEHGNFSAAARKLGISPCAISQSVGRLERELGSRLFDRSTRRQTLTEEGRRVYSQCRGPVDYLEAVIRQRKENHDEPAGHLRVSLPPSFGCRYVLPLMSRFGACYPKVGVFFGMHDAYRDWNDGFDIGVCIGILPDSRLAARHLADTPLYVVAAPAYWARHGKPAQPNGLAEHDCINYQYATTGRMCKWEFELEGERLPLEVHGTYTADDVAAVVDLARLGLGVAQLPAHEVLPYFRTGELEPVLLDYVSCERSITLCFPRRDYIAPHTRVFVDFLAEHLTTNPDIIGKWPQDGG